MTISHAGSHRPQVSPRTASTLTRPWDEGLVPRLIGLSIRLLLLACGVTLFISVAASDGQVLNIAWWISTRP